MGSGYYVYLIDDDGHITNRVVAVCNNDDEAKRYAKQLIDGRAVELWQGTRCIATFQPSGLSNESSDF